MSQFGAPLEEVWGPSSQLVKGPAARVGKKKRDKKDREKRCKSGSPVCSLERFGYDEHLTQVMDERTPVTGPNVVTPFPSSYPNPESERIDFYDKWDKWDKGDGPTGFDGLSSLSNLSSYASGRQALDEPESESNVEAEDGSAQDGGAQGGSAQDAQGSHYKRVHVERRRLQEADAEPPQQPQPQQPQQVNPTFVLADMGLYMISGILLIVIIEIFIKLGMRMASMNRYPMV